MSVCQSVGPSIRLCDEKWSDSLTRRLYRQNVSKLLNLVVYIILVNRVHPQKKILRTFETKQIFIRDSGSVLLIKKRRGLDFRNNKWNNALKTVFAPKNKKVASAQSSSSKRNPKLNSKKGSTDFGRAMRPDKIEFNLANPHRVLTGTGGEGREAWEWFRGNSLTWQGLLKDVVFRLHSYRIEPIRGQFFKDDSPPWTTKLENFGLSVCMSVCMSG